MTVNYSHSAKIHYSVLSTGLVLLQPVITGVCVCCMLLQSATLTYDKDTVREVSVGDTDTRHDVDLSPPTSSSVVTLNFSL